MFQKKFYTLIMVDPDAPPQIDGEFYLHMVKSNIPVSRNSILKIVLKKDCEQKTQMYIFNFQGLALKAKESSKTVGIDYRGESLFSCPSNICPTLSNRSIELLNQ